MDPSLLRERDAFKKRALAMPTIEKRKHKSREDDRNKPAKKMKKEPPRSSARSDFDYKSSTGSSQFNFGILAKIVKHMRERHKIGDIDPLTLDDVLDETNQRDITQRQRYWLGTEALGNNPKIEVVDGNTFKYKPKYNIKDKKALLRLLDKNDQNGMGGLLRDDVEESLPNAARVLKILGDKVLIVTRPDKKQILFYNDRSSSIDIDEELQKLWRSVTVEGVDERKVEEYLQKQGITSMQDIEVKKATAQKKRRQTKRGKNMKSNNEHMGDVLQDYSAVTK